ncbi:hypothetical protein [Paenibacillus donghaensis]|uniref:Uncharacterized protein n=1 Tax=Paenibacillus donghaensis TaxID=414771 RepID=A0A2Z2KMY9_9BACL|nr:hypothetical protein [Paenibacillus donghaensis]ASA24930.1 hypothetical protein B9T62_31755 [Paenibacillus donghaensis]
MELKGWDNLGRNLDDTLHHQFKGLMEFLADPILVNGRTWNNSLQIDVAAAIGVKSPGQVRTIKSILEKMGIIKINSLNMRIIPTSNSVITPLGEVLLALVSIEERIGEIAAENHQIRKSIETMYESFYVKALIQYHFPDGARKSDSRTPFHPLHATIKALHKYHSLDKWEWYLLNTFILENENPTQEQQFDNAINQYRAHTVTFSKADITENEKGHQYFPQYLGLSGLVTFQKVGRTWERMELGGNYTDIINCILDTNFINCFFNNNLSVLNEEIDWDDDEHAEGLENYE